MSTNACVAIHKGAKGDGTHRFAGSYHHWDGYPNGLGYDIFRQAHENVGSLRKTIGLILKHANWSSILDSDLTLPARGELGDNGISPLCKICGEKALKHNLSEIDHEPYFGPICGCHDYETGEPFLHSASGRITDENIDEWTGIEYVYAFNFEQDRVYIRKEYFDEESDDWKCEWSFIDISDWENESPEMLAAKMECGDNLENCDHSAIYHFPDMREAHPPGRFDISMPTRKYVGMESLDARDAIGCTFEDATVGYFLKDKNREYEKNKRLLAKVMLFPDSFDPASCILLNPNKEEVESMQGRTIGLTHREALMLIRDDKKIQAIKSVRTRCPLSLKESKDVVNNFEKDHNVSNNVSKGVLPVIYKNEGYWQVSSIIMGRTVRNIIMPETYKHREGTKVKNQSSSRFEDMFVRSLQNAFNST